jgi:hypothetical protein
MKTQCVVKDDHHDVCHHTRNWRLSVTSSLSDLNVRDPSNLAILNSSCDVRRFFISTTFSPLKLFSFGYFIGQTWQKKMLFCLFISIHPPACPSIRPLSYFSIFPWLFLPSFLNSLVFIHFCIYISFSCTFYCILSCPLYCFFSHCETRSIRTSQTAW